MRDSIFERLVHSDQTGWLIARTVLVIAPILTGMVLGITIFLDAWRQ